MILLATGLAINLAKGFRTETNAAPECASNEECVEYLHWDMAVFCLDKIEIAPNAMLGPLLSQHGVEYFKIDQLINAAKSIFPLRSIRAGKELTLVKDQEDETVHAFIYEPDPYRRILYHLEDSVRVEVQERPTEIRIETAGGRIDETLWASMVGQGLPWDLAMSMDNALGWSVDFYHIQKGDTYKLLYERKYVEGEPVGIGRLLGAVYTTGGNEYYAIMYNSGKHDGYFDLEGRPMKKAFLKAPVEYSRISSRYSQRRFHPVLKRYKGHFGTDYAANCGSPIRAVADGRVTHAAYTSGNGNYVKIRHDKTYETQYLHMSKFGEGIRPGTQVKQGQTIGYVGKTGLATGCHVCFRFWKNGQQVDHLREKMPPPESMPKEMLPDYFRFRDGIKCTLDAIPIPSTECEYLTKTGTTVSDNQS